MQTSPAAMALTLHSRDVVLIRHGETAWSLSGRHTGRTDLELTDRGRAGARHLREPLAGLAIRRVLCSPLLRARQTCDLAGLAERAELDPDLQEWDYGDYEGLTSDQIQQRAPHWLVFRDGCPNGESPDAVATRVDRVLQRVRAGEEGPVALVAHGHLLRALAARWLGWPVAAGRHFLLDTATLNVLSHYRDAPAIRCWNAVL
jgi:probable phosphoglycerate mutase